MTTELEQLLATSTCCARGVLKKLTGLKRERRRSTVDSGTNVAAWSALTSFESLWFEEIVAGGTASRGKRRCRSIQAVSEDRPRRLPGRLRRLEAIITGLGDPDVPITRNGKTHDLRGACWPSSRRPPGTPARRHHPRTTRRHSGPLVNPARDT